MKLQFKIQQYQTDAVDAVVDCFAGQPKSSGISYRIDPGRERPTQGTLEYDEERADAGFRNAEIGLSCEQLLDNIHAVQTARNLPKSPALVNSKAAPKAPNLDVEMETGTGKTYVYIKTIMEMHQRYGWSKYIIVVPSIAIREGVKKSFDLTADHFQQRYGTKPRCFVYNSKQLEEIEAFSSGNGVQVMIINIQAFNAHGKDNRRIYEELDDFGSRRPIDVISANRPIVIIDEPQKIGAAKSLVSLSRFNALMLLRYSATHKVEHVKVHRLDAVDAYNAKLVKKIAVRGITVKGLAGSSAYLYLDSITIKKGSLPTALIELEVQTATAIKRKVKRVNKGSRLHDLSNGLEAYRDLVVIEIDAVRDVIELSNGDIITAGQLAGDANEEVKRRIQIREVIAAHLEKERELHSRGIKVLSLFFIDEVAKYRDYSREDTLGEYARTFEEEYRIAVDAILGELPFEEAAAYRGYLTRDLPNTVHAGYFSIDKNGHAVEGSIAKTGDEKGQSKDSDAYDLILKDKERLLSLDEPVRFIFSHSALREGWDNPNVFTLGMLKKSDNTVSRRQEVGRGLRLAVDQHGERMDHPSTVHDINILTVVTDESYTDFVAGLQKEIAESLSARPRKASVAFFEGKTYLGADGVESVIEAGIASLLYKYLIKNDYLNDDDTIAASYKADREAGTTAAAAHPQLEPVLDLVFPVVDSLYLEIPVPIDARKPKEIPFNRENFERKEFQRLWNTINHKVVYQVEFDSDELISKCIRKLDSHLTVAPLQYVTQVGRQRNSLGAEDLSSGTGFKVGTTRTHTESDARSQVKYDLLGEITEKASLTRRTVARILTGVTPATFAKFKQNPEQFITETSRLINEQKADVVIEHLSYDTLEDRFDSVIFTENRSKQDFTHAGDKLRNHVYEYVVTDSQVEHRFVTELDTSAEVAVYAKLPRGFVIPTPVGDYNPDWAIAFKEGTVKHVYFVAETKGSLSSLQLKGIEKAKIECARKYFAELSSSSPDEVVYNVVTDYTELMQLVSQ